MAPKTDDGTIPKSTLLALGVYLSADLTIMCGKFVVCDHLSERKTERRRREREKEERERRRRERERMREREGRRET